MKPLAGCAILMTIALPQLADAADLGAASEPAPAYAATYAPPAFDGYYIRLDVGAARSDTPQFSQADLAVNGGKFVSESLGTQPVLAIGIGRQITPWIRADLTGEYRVPSSLGAYDNLTATLISNGEIFRPIRPTEVNIRHLLAWQTSTSILAIGAVSRPMWAPV